MSENPEAVLFTRINIGSQQFSNSPGSSGLTRQDILAAIGMEHVPKHVWLMAQAYYLSDESVLSELSKSLWLSAVDLAIKYQWKIPRGEEVLRRMSVLALVEIFQPQVCNSCKGEPKRSDECEKCHGSGIGGFSKRKKAELCGVSKDAWIRTWVYRYQEILWIAKSWITEADCCLSRHSSSLKSLSGESGVSRAGSTPKLDWGFNPGQNRRLKQEEEKRAKSAGKSVKKKLKKPLDFLRQKKLVFPTMT